MPTTGYVLKIIMSKYWEIILGHLTTTVLTIHKLSRLTPFVFHCNVKIIRYFADKNVFRYAADVRAPEKKRACIPTAKVFPIETQ